MIVWRHGHTETSRPWETRRFGECAFPLEDEAGVVHSCCAPAHKAGSYCKKHYRAVFRSNAK